MKTLFINPAWDAAATSIKQCHAINAHTGWKARHFRAVRTFYSDFDIGPENYNRDEFRHILETTDVIEWCSADHLYKSEHNFGFDLWEIAKKKINIFHDYNSFVGTWEDRAKDKSVWNRRKDVGYDAIFSSIPQARYIYDGCIYIPDVVDELSPEYTPDPNRDFSKIRLGHYPTGGGNNKNTQELREALSIISKEFLVECNIPEKTIFHDELLRRKRKINLGFDALWRGFHGMTSVENMALGIPTMCRIDESFYPAFEECFGTTDVPFINVVDSVSIANCLRHYSDYNCADLIRRSDYVRRFALEKWSFKNIANRIVGEYEKLLGKK